MPVETEKPPLTCGECDSDETVIYPAEDDDEPTVLHCYACGHEEQL